MPDVTLLEGWEELFNFSMCLLSGFDRQRGLKIDVTFGEAFPYDGLVCMELYGIRDL